MSSGGGLFDRRFAPFWRGPPVIAVGGFGARALPIRAGVSSALTGGGPSLTVADSELERGGASGDGLIVDEKGTYMADAGRPVGVHVRSERSEAEPESEDPYESSEGGEAGVDGSVDADPVRRVGKAKKTVAFAFADQKDGGAARAAGGEDADDGGEGEAEDHDAGSENESHGSDEDEDSGEDEEGGTREKKPRGHRHEDKEAKKVCSVFPTADSCAAGA